MFHINLKKINKKNIIMEYVTKKKVFLIVKQCM